MQWQMRRHIMHKETPQAKKALAESAKVDRCARSEPHGPGSGGRPQTVKGRGNGA